MAWQYRPRSPEGESANTLYQYHERQRAAELRDGLEVNLDTEPHAGPIDMGRLRNVALLWAVAVLAIAGFATWFLDRVLAAEIVAVVTATALFTPLAHARQTSDREPSR